MKKITIQNGTNAQDLSSAKLISETNTFKVQIDSPLKDIKIADAFLFAKTKQPLPSTTFRVNYYLLKSGELTLRWQNVDLIEAAASNITINISDELQDAIDFSADHLVLQFQDTANIGNQLTFDASQSSLQVEYLSLAEYRANGSCNKIDLDQAGAASIDLVDGELSAKTTLLPPDNNVLPLSISANYNAHQSQLMPKTGLPTNWSLNLSQFLIKNQSDNELCFTYIDANGKEQALQEQYFLDSQHQLPLPASKLSVDLNGNLVYKDESGKIQPVYTNLQAPCGLKLVSSIEGIPGYTNVDYEPEELINVKTQLKNLQKSNDQIEKYIANGNKQICLLILAKKLADIKLQAKLANLGDNNNETLNKQVYEDIISKQSLQTYVTSYLTTYAQKNNIDVADISIDGCQLDDIYKSFSPSGSLTYAQTDLISADLQIENYIASNITYAAQLAEQKQLEQKLLNQKEQLEAQVPVHYLCDSNNIIYGFGKVKKQQTIKATCKYCGDNCSCNKLIISDVSNASDAYASQTSSATASDAIGSANQPATAVDVPVTNNPSGECTSMTQAYTKYVDDNIYRLILIADAYQNTITISYKSPCESIITSVTDSNQKTINFEYNNDDLLTKITDAQGNIVALQYSNQNLSGITSPSGAISHYYYQNGKLSAIINADYLGAKFTYNAQGKVASTHKISALSSLSQNGITPKADIFAGSQNGEAPDFSAYIVADSSVTYTYNNYKSTTIKNAGGKSYTYLFDKLGNVRTIYQGNLAEDPAKSCLNVTQFNYQDNIVSQKISLLPNSANLLADVSFGGEIPEATNSPQLGLTACGDDDTLRAISACEGVYNSATNGKTTHALTLSSNAISAINNAKCSCGCNNLCYCLTGWAKADSAFIITDETADFAQYIKDRKFQLKAQVLYTGNATPAEFTKQFDWRNTDWQYCALPITIDPLQSVQSITCQIDYTGNTGNISYTNLQLRQADWESITTQTTPQGKIETKTCAHSNWQTQYFYNTNNQLIKKVDKNLYPTSTNEQTEFVTTHQYTSGGKLLRTVDHNGIVTENVYNKNGQVIKTLTYHKDAPGEKFYQEQVLDEKGKQQTTLNQLGKQISSSEFGDATGLVSQSTNNSGNTTSYAYNTSSTLLQTSTTIDGEANTNIYGYTLSYLTSLTHNGFSTNYTYGDQGKLTSVSIAGQNYLTNAYSGNQQTTTLATGEVFAQTFNNDGNPLSTSYNGNAMAQNFYDTYGNLTCTKDKVADQTTKIYLDSFGNTIKQQVLKGTDKDASEILVNIASSYNPNSSNLSTCSVDVGGSVTNYSYTYDQTPDSKLLGLDVTNTGGQSVLTQKLTYDQLGRTSSVQTNNNSIVKYKYLTSGDHTTNLVSKMYFNNSSDCFSYKYDDYGNITEVRHLNDLVARYKYDDLNRLIREDNKELDKTTTFTYDAGGNITQRREYVFTLVDNLEYEDFIPYTYTYSLTGWADQLLCYNGQTFTYDKIGNPTIYRDNVLEWSHGRRLDRFNNIEYKYNASGIRTSKVVDGIKTNYVYNGNKLLQLTQGDHVMTFRYGVNGVAGFNLDGDEYLYKKNLQGDIIGLFNEQNKQIAQYTYDAWGNVSCKILSNNVTVVANNQIHEYTISVLDELAILLNPFAYRSYIYDEETKLYYLNSRYYDPEIGRFINADDINILIPSSCSINGLNLYTYCFNNPVVGIDQNGHGFWSWIWNGIKNIGKAIGSFVTTIVGAVTEITTNEISDSINLFFLWTESGFGHKETIGESRFIDLRFSSGSKWWKFWEYRFGIGINIGKLSTSLDVGAGLDFSISYDNSGLSFGIDFLGGVYSQLTLSDNNGNYSYSKITISLLRIMFAYALIHFLGPISIPVFEELPKFGNLLPLH